MTNASVVEPHPVHACRLTNAEGGGFITAFVGGLLRGNLMI